MNVAEKVIELISEISVVPKNEICPTDELRMLGIDSLLSVEVLVSIEDMFGIIFQDSDVCEENLKSVGSVIALTKLYVRD